MSESSKPNVAVIGAGISGLFCARQLTNAGLSVSVFEKSRGAGGRMSTRRGEAQVAFDHGAQYFTARDSRFQEYVEQWIGEGIVQKWDGRIVVVEGGLVESESVGTDRYVGVPAMNSICKHLADGLDIKLNCHVAPPQRQTEGQWLLADVEGDELGLFDHVIITSPAQQAADLLDDAPTLSNLASNVAMNRSWAVMLALDAPSGLGFDGAFVNKSPLSWIARNSSKPGREQTPETWVLHSTADWAAKNFELPTSDVEDQLLAEFSQATGLASLSVQSRNAHRWKYALPPEPLPESCYYESDQGVGICGDWCGGPRVEGAFLSGLAMAETIIGSLE